MDRFEEGMFDVGKKRMKGEKWTIFQTAFESLKSLKPLDNEEEIFKMLSDLVDHGPQKKVSS